MAQSLASVAGLRGASQAVLEGSLQLNGSSRLPAPAPHHRVAVSRPGLAVRAQQAPAEGEATAQSGRRAVLGLVAAGLAGGSFAQAVLAEAKSIKVGPPPPPSGGLRKFSGPRHSSSHILLRKHLCTDSICACISNSWDTKL